MQDYNNNLVMKDTVSKEIIRMTPVESVGNIPKVWDVRFSSSKEFIGVVEEVSYGYLFTNSFKHQVECFDFADVRDELKKQFIPMPHMIN